MSRAQRSGDLGHEGGSPQRRAENTAAAARRRERGFTYVGVLALLADSTNAERPGRSRHRDRRRRRRATASCMSA